LCWSLRCQTVHFRYPTSLLYLLTYHYQKVYLYKIQYSGLYYRESWGAHIQSWYCRVMYTVYTYVLAKYSRSCRQTPTRRIALVGDCQMHVLYGEGTNMVQRGYANRRKMTAPHYTANMVRRTSRIMTCTQVETCQSSCRTIHIWLKITSIIAPSKCDATTKFGRLQAVLFLTS
jgi:hypothetical protein